ncbi:unnamed protein product [Zymoseptoria tritici ST99CH_3D1]|nr:unnamed protein product [Zymoseptoria tritici ST99CH_3D1]
MVDQATAPITTARLFHRFYEVIARHSPMATSKGKNIMVQRLEGDSQHPQLPSWRIHIIDWEKSGWYPTYWDHAMASCALRWDDDWCLWVQKALDPYPSEAAWLQIIRLELWS